MGDIEVPDLALGCAALGRVTVDDYTSVATVEAALAGGITVLDTAPHYGAGLSESRVGRALHVAGRSQLVISTKVGRTIVDGRTELDHTYDGAWRSIEGSLERLGVDRVDVLHAHDPVDVAAAIDGEFKALAEMRDQGLAGAIGGGMNHADDLVTYLREVDLDVVLVANRLNLLDQGAAEHLLPLARERGADVWVAGVYGTGILASPKPGATYFYQPASPEVMKRVLDIEAVCRWHDTALTAAAMHYPWKFGVSRLVVGAGNPSEVHEITTAAEAKVPVELWAALQEQGLVAAP